jgi:hypothetical protein
MNTKRSQDTTATVSIITEIIAGAHMGQGMALLQILFITRNHMSSLKFRNLIQAITVKVGPKLLLIQQLPRIWEGPPLAMVQVEHHKLPTVTRNNLHTLVASIEMQAIASRPSNNFQAANN